ncbi:MAG: fructose-bisphosphate aldolase [Nanoarchaeota archaeon]|nr:fructose-bisphosphate aldolase [Nanoarchaeota archaeon]
MKINTKKLLHNDRSLMLACDQGLEHGPKDFNLKNIDPQYIFDIAHEGRYNAVIVQSGIAEKFYHGPYRDIPLVVKINGKTSLLSGEPISPQICSVDRALKIGASAIGYTLYPGSEHEGAIYENFGKVVEQAHDYGIPVIAWMYPRGKNIPNDIDTEILAYSARIGQELGADILKMKYNGDKEAYKWVVRNAGRAKLMVAGGVKGTPAEFLQKTKDVLDAGATGMAIGRNVWQSEQPFTITHALRDLMFNHRSVQDVLKYFEK